MIEKSLNELATRVVHKLRDKGLTMATAESCTGGIVASALTSVAGCSQVFNGAVVAYSNEVKASVLGVPQSILDVHGAVSEPVVAAMARGVCRITNSNCAVATSGVAGPGGGTPEKPVGTVWVAVVVNDITDTMLLQLQDKGRQNNICATAEKVLSLLLNLLQQA